jgi:hypothetical protein
VFPACVDKVIGIIGLRWWWVDVQPASVS